MAEVLIYCECEDLTKDILVEIGKSLTKNDTAHETTGVKNISSFLETIAEKAAKTLLSQMPSVIHLLDCEAYQLRNAAVSIMGNIAIHVFSGNEELEDPDARLRNDEKKNNIIQHLMNRNRDKSALARARSLHVLSDLVDKNVINQSMHYDFLKIACHRIKDIASNVRKKAMQLLWKEITIFAVVIFKDKVFLTREELNEKIEKNKKELENMEKIMEERKVQAPPEQKMEVENKKPTEHIQEVAKVDAEDINEERQKKQAWADYYDLYGKFLGEIDAIVPSIVQLLGSKNSSDVIESVQVLTALYKRKIGSALVKLIDIYIY